AQCESLVSEQRRITKLADEMNEDLRYYAYLEPITRRLNAPGAGNLVRGKDFPEMLLNLDNCLDYMQAHVRLAARTATGPTSLTWTLQPTHRESNTYRSRYRLLLTRALTLIRVHFTNSLRETAADVSKRIADRQLNDTTTSALLYAKFRTSAPELKALGLEIQKRAVPAIDDAEGKEPEYQSLVNELYQSYSATRGRLILPIVTKKMGETASSPSGAKDLVGFARSGISYVRSVCLDEYELWGDWFVGEGGLYDFLEAVCEPLYDYLRPRTIHETQILKLCELCTLIQTQYMEDEDDGEGEDSDASPINGDLPKSGLNFAVLIQPALEDAQTRLVFLALAVLRDDIEHYKPKPEDLDYPGKNRSLSHATTNGKQPALSGRKSSVKSPPQTPMPKTPFVVEEAGEDFFGERWALDREASFDGWYPTLRKASTVFDDLAHRIVHTTTLSLVSAASLISTRASPTDGTLFLISHLLLLKQQIVAFDIEFVTSEVGFDFSSVTNTFYELRDRGGFWNPASWVRLVGGGLMPRVVENMLDAKAELDGRLRTGINDFVAAFAQRMTSPIAPAEAAPKGFDARVAAAAVRANVEKEIPFLRVKLQEYLADARTRETLVLAVRDSVVSAYEEFWEGYEDGVKREGKTVSKKGKGREGEVWDAGVFAEWCERTFGVGPVVGDGDDEVRSERSF
ncbi:hypothetical protein LTR28_010639, partial [Elasticomyces elasticus]